MSNRLLAASLACLFAVSCSRPAPEATSAPAPAAGPTESVAPAPASSPAEVTVHNAYTAASPTQDGAAMEPGRTFKSNEAVYVVVVLRGQAESSEVTTQWSSSLGGAPGSESKRLAVGGEAQASFDLNSGRRLDAGAYKVLVSLDGKPSWELDFTVVE